MTIASPRETFGERFLREPDLFPGRISGAAWGSEESRLDLAGGPYRFRGASAGLRELVERRFAPRILPAGPDPGDVSLHLLQAPPSDFLPVSNEPWATRFDLAHSERSVELAGDRFFARIDGVDGEGVPEGGLWFPPIEDEDTLSGTIENFLRVVAAYRVTRAGGVLLHSAGIVVDGEAWLFVGRSGAGKSTLSKLSRERGFDVLSDELNALRREDGRLVVERMPFAGDLGRAPGEGAGRREAFPLRAIHALRQGSEPAIAPVSRAAALGELVAASPFLNVDPFRDELLLGNLERLLADFPVAELTFRLDPGFWDLLRGAA